MEPFVPRPPGFQRLDALCFDHWLGLQFLVASIYLIKLLANSLHKLLARQKHGLRKETGRSEVLPNI